MAPADDDQSLLDIKVRGEVYKILPGDFWTRIDLFLNNNNIWSPVRYT